MNKNLQNRLAYQKRKLIINDKIFYPLKECLIFDIETKKINKNGPISAENSKLVIWGAYSFQTNKIYMGKSAPKFQELLNTHRIIIGHNIKDFDMPVMRKDLGINFWDNLPLDLWEILRKPPSKSEKEAFIKKGKKPRQGKGRSLIIGEARINGMQDNRFPDLKLSTIAKHGYKLFKDHPVYNQYFHEYKQDDFDYDILEKEEITPEDWVLIKTYLKQDLIVTKNIFEFLEKYFESLAFFLPESDIKNLEYVHAPTGKYAYKVICHELGLPEEYSEAMRKKFEGAFVFLPEKESYGPDIGDGYCIDFNSQHPSHQRMMNLFTPVENCKHKVNGYCPNPHSGDQIIFNLLGTYCACEQGSIEKLLTKWYKLRLKYKAEKDPREYTIKILINATYGISSSSIFKSIFYEFCGPDTTRMSKQSIKYMAKHMKAGGYIVVYGDTDSIYIFDPYHDEERMKKWRDIGIAKIKEVLPFADEHYGMGVDAKLSHIFFFKDDKDLAYKKKNYIYLQYLLDKNGNKTGKQKVKINGLPILKSNAPKLAKLIFIQYLEPEILRTQNIKFNKEYIRQLIMFEIGKDMSILKTKMRVQPAASYASESQLQAQVSQKYLNGRGGFIELIKHNRKGFGVGKGKFYCSLDDAKQIGLHELDLDTIWKTLEPFILEEKQLKVQDFFT